MAGEYAFQVSLPVTDLLARNRIVNRFHLKHVTGGIDDAALESMCEDIAEMYQTRYESLTKEIDVRAYDTDAVPNYPRAHVIVNPGIVWTQATPREIALCLSYAGANRGNKRERGRMYLNPAITGAYTGVALRPTAGQMTWALKWYTEPNASLPDLGGVDWKFGVLSRVGGTFTQTQQAWVNDDWDVQRRRGLRESTRQTATREG